MAPTAWGVSAFCLGSLATPFTHPPYLIRQSLGYDRRHTRRQPAGLGTLDGNA